MVFKLGGKKTKKKVEEKSIFEEEPAPELGDQFVVLPSQPEEPPVRILGLIGDVDEEKAAESIYGLLALHAAAGEKDKKGKGLPIDFYISTHGGSASDMFAVYDVMRQVKKDVDVCTIGLGKVMSAGVLLLAAGTKGKRKIGKNCRVMIHSVLAGNEGPLHNLENEMNEIRWTQDSYASALIAETKMTPTIMKKLLEKHVNVYLSAEEAVKYGIADEVI